MKKYQITNGSRFRIFIIVVLCAIAVILSCILFSQPTTASTDTELMDTPLIDMIAPMSDTISESVSQTIEEFQLLHPVIEITETNDYVYTTDSVHYHTGPDITYDILGTMSRGEEIYRIGICDNGWCKVFINNLECFMSSDYLSTEKPVIQVTQTTTTSSKYSPDYLRNMGVVYDGGWRYTWYSERVLPGGGLNIPGRWSDRNFVRDENGYICVASSDLAKGTVIDTPWGVAKVYDCGCASGTIDVYTSWG